MPGEHQHGEDDCVVQVREQVHRVQPEQYDHDGAVGRVAPRDVHGRELEVANRDQQQAGESHHDQPQAHRAELLLLGTTVEQHVRHETQQQEDRESCAPTGAWQQPIWRPGRLVP
jgi:hypothetical protein